MWSGVSWEPSWNLTRRLRERVNEHPPFSSLANTFVERFRDKGVEAHTFGGRRDCDSKSFGLIPSS